jgi:sec-independent protein translocase protein TatA
MPGNIGPMELFIVLAIVLVIFGPKRLPGLGRQLGRGMKEFKDSITDRHDRDDDEAQPSLAAAATNAETAPAAAAPEPVAADRTPPAEPATAEPATADSATPREPGSPRP